MESVFILTIYVALIAFFYDQTDGFKNTQILRYCILKSIPIYALAALVYLKFSTLTGMNRIFHALGLFFSACGDFFISIHENGLPVAAILFAIGHIMYIAVFAHGLRRLAGELVIPGLFCVLVMNHFFLIPELSHSPISTLILMAYSLILCSALVVSGSLYFHGTKQLQLPKQKGDMLRFLGYFIFVVSDSLLLLDHSGCQLPNPALIVLSTYYIAQYLILLGAVETNYDVLKARDTITPNGSTSSGIMAKTLVK